MGKIKEFIDGIENNKLAKNITMGILSVITLALFILIVVKIIDLKTTVTDIERIKLTEVSDSIMPYMEEIEDNKDKNIDKYINYALVYSSNEYNKNELTSKEMKKLLSKIFSKKITEEELKSAGITEYLLEKSVVYDPAKDVYKVNKAKQTYSDIANTKVVKYEIKSMKKKKGKYTVVYKKYEVTNPYEVLNSYLSQEKETKSVEEINNYLKGKGTKKDFKKYITKDNISKVGKETGEIKVVYTVEKDNILAELK